VIVSGALLAAGIVLPLITIRTSAQERTLTYSVLYNFTGGADGASPRELVRDAAGNLYGTTQYGGNTSSSCPFGSSGCGVVFKVDPSGIETVLHSFTGTDGYAPVASLLVSTALCTARLPAGAPSGVE
jgi:uncharacterized repeat protein (TIGR03803 family)